MGWNISTKKVEGVDHYKIWSTITDSYITEWLNRDGIVKFLFWHRLNRLIKDFTEDAMTFPNGYTSKSGKLFRDVDKVEAFNELLIKSCEGEYNALAEKFIEILKSKEIEFSITDGKYNINTNE